MEHSSAAAVTLLVHLILRITSLQSPSITVPWLFTPHLKLISFTNPFLHIFYTFFSSWSGLPYACAEQSGHWRLFALVSFIVFGFWLRVLV